MWIGKGIRNGINYGIYEYDEYCKCVNKKELQKQMEKDELQKELQKERTENILKHLKERQEILKQKRKEQQEKEDEEEEDDKVKVLKILENINIDDIIKEFQIKNNN
jgi:hypothetical protein